MSQQDTAFKNLTSHCKEYGFIYPSSEIYDGLGAVYDYGPFGVELKKNIKEYWWKAMVQMHENIVGLDTAILMHPTTWKASGHVDAFNDPMIDNKDSKKRYRADVLIEDHLEKLEGKISKEIEKARKRFGDAFDEDQFRQTNPRVQANQEKIDRLNASFSEAMEQGDLEKIQSLIIEAGIVDPASGSKNWTEVRQFNLMFSTKMGASAEDGIDLYLRPETAQGSYANFLNVQKTARMKLPFGIAQIGKAFRNELIARQFIFRMREFEQMELQFFVQPGSEMKWYEYWKEQRMKWHRALGTDEKKLRYHEHIKLAHYANAAVDIQFEFPFGFKELEGIHSRTDFDLKQHQEHSKKKIQYFDSEKESAYVPYVVETALGLDRMFLTVLSNAYVEEIVDEGKGSTRVVLKIPPALAPFKVAILPLLNKDGLPEKALEIFNSLRHDTMCHYEMKDSIGKRYRRQDAVGTALCVTVDHQSLEDETVTIRDRDSMKQERISISEIKKWVHQKTSWQTLFQD